MNRWKICSIIMFSCAVFMMVGCASAIPELSEEEQDIITQYMADCLLRYDANYEYALLDEEELAAALEEQREKEEEASELAEYQAQLEQQKIEESRPDDIEIYENENKAGVEQMAESIGLADVEFEYLGYELCERYPNAGEGLYFAMTPSMGNELLVMKFNLANVGGTDYLIDIISTKTNFAIKVNGGNYAPVLTTLLDNDLTLLEHTLPVEQGMEVVLVAEVAAGTQVEDLVLYIRAQDGNTAVELH